MSAKVEQEQGAGVGPYVLAVYPLLILENREKSHHATPIKN
jgi:hypothetical protein